MAEVTQTPRVFDLDQLDFEKNGGTVTVVTQDARTGAVLMVAAADRRALERTIATGETHYRSRTRGHWHKGATSGNVQKVRSLTADCDRDAVLARVVPAGPACHTGATTCFGESAADTLATLSAVIRKRASDDVSTSYTCKLLGDRNLRLKKISEEAGEFVVACADADPERATEEAADLIYHALVALRALDLDIDDVRALLDQRSK